MAKYDAFGREIGENTLAGLGGNSVVTPPADQGQAAAPEPAAPEAAAPEAAAPPKASPPAAAKPPVRAQPRRKPRGGRGIAFVIVAIVAGIQLLAKGSHDTSTAPKFAPPSIVTPAGGRGGAAAPSLLAPGRFGAALAKLRAAQPGRPFTFRLDADRIDGSFVTNDNRIRIVEVPRSLEVQTLATSGSASAALRPFSLDALRAGAPARLIHAAARRMHQHPSTVNYLVADALGDGLRWTVFFKNGRSAIGDARGRLTYAF